jgi:hypothetical protein
MLGLADLQVFPIPLSPSAATLMRLTASVANKGLVVQLNPLDATLMKNRGRGLNYG